MLEDFKIQSFCIDICENLCDHLTVIKGYFDLSKDKAEMKFSNELRREIEEMEITIKGCIDKIADEICDGF